MGKLGLVPENLLGEGKVIDPLERRQNGHCIGFRRRCPKDREIVVLSANQAIVRHDARGEPSVVGTDGKLALSLRGKLALESVNC